MTVRWRWRWRYASLYRLFAYFLTFVVGWTWAGGGGGGGGGGDMWPLDRPEGMTQIQSLEVMCGKDHMDVHLSFTQPFEGIVFSKGQYGDARCVYVLPSTGRTFFSFRIAYTRCGTKPDLHGQFYENTVVVQYDKDLLEVWDEAKRLRCEWFNDYEKTASKPPMVIADLDVIQLDFRGDNVDCWMEIQHGKGPWAPPVSGIVPLGSTLTLVVAINDYRGEFDMRVKSCAASDGAGHVIQLSDEDGCVLRPKMISRFLKVKGADERASVITYAFFHAFKFPDALSVHIKCKVEICRHGCLDHCQQPGDINHQSAGPGIFGDLLERKDTHHSEDRPERPDRHKAASPPRRAEGARRPDPPPPRHEQPPSAMSILEALYDDQDVDVNPSGRDPSHVHHHLMPEKDEPLPRPQFQEMSRPSHRDAQDSRFPHGPRHLESEEQADPVKAAKDTEGEDSGQEAPKSASPSPRGLPDHVPVVPVVPVVLSAPSSVRSSRKTRSVVVSDRKVRSADVGVSGIYEVISEADLAFTPDSKAEAVTIFQGRIREEVVYGICLPMQGFSAIFAAAAVSAVVAALVAGFLLYRYQLQKEAAAIVQQRAAVRNGAAAGAVGAGWTNWAALRMLRSRLHPCTPTRAHSG